MKKALFAMLLASLLALSGCAPRGTGDPAAATTPPRLHVAATTYPVYCLTRALTQGVDGVAVTAVINEPMSCLHDYTLTVANMKVLERADIIAMNGLGLEDFMSDAFQTSKAALVDCSAGVDVLYRDDGTADPHIWMDPNRAAVMLKNICDGLVAQDADQAAAYTANYQQALLTLEDCQKLGQSLLVDGEAAPVNRELITFHDGFRYLAESTGLTILRAIEEEEGSEASAQEIQEMVSLIRGHKLPAIFTEVNGATAAAQAIARETGVPVVTLTMLMSGDAPGLTGYVEGMEGNYQALHDALGEGT